MNNNNNIDWKKYLIVFIITSGLFVTASYLSNFFNNIKLNELKSIQDKISIDILSSETQFALLSDLSCSNVSTNVLAGELGELGRKLEWGQENLGDSQEVTSLRKYYSLLQIKDYLLMNKVNARCGIKSAFVLYFYTTADNCTECERQGIVLSALRDKYENVRVYSFDYSTDLSAVKSMLQIYKIEDTKLPALVVGDKVLTGFQAKDDLEKIILEAFDLAIPETEEDTPKDQTKI